MKSIKADKKERESLAGPLVMGLLITFGAMANGAHDIWAATIVYIVTLGIVLTLLIKLGWKNDAAGIRVQFQILLTAMLAIIFFSSQFSVNRWDAFYEWADWATAIFLFWIALQIFQSEKSLSVLLGVMVLVIFFQVGINLTRIIELRQLTLFPPVRAAGTLVNANIAAAFTLLWIPPLFNQVQRSTNSVSSVKWFWRLGLAFCLINLAWTLSASAWLCFFVALPFMIGQNQYLNFKKRYPTLFWLAVSLLVVAIFYLATRKIFEAINEKDIYQNIITSRIHWWKSGFAMFLDYPFLGVGPGCFGSSYLAYMRGAGEHALFSHSWIFGYLAELGLLGGGAIGVFFYRWGRESYRIIHKNLERKPYFLSVILFWMTGAVNLGPEYLINLMTAFLLMGIVLSPAASFVWKPRQSVVVILAALGLAFVPTIISPFLASQDVVHGNARLKQGDWEAALESFRSAAQLDKKSWQAYRGWSHSLHLKYQRLGQRIDLENAVNLQRGAIRLNRLNGRLVWELGTYLEEAGEKSAALLEYERAIQLHRTNRTYQDSFRKLQQAD